MRLSTQYMYQHNIDSLSKAMTSGNDIYMRLSAQRNLLTPSDDPAGASQAVIYQNALSNMNQFDTARLYAKDALELEDNILTSLGNILTKNLSEKIVAGGNGVHSDADRQALATELQGIRDNMLDLANSTNSSGRFIFAGFNTGTRPFLPDGSYVGGDSPMTQIVADSTEMQVGHTGRDVFMSGSADDLFVQLDKAIAALNTPVDTDADREALQQTLDSVNISIKKGIDNLGKVQAQVGTSLQQIDSLDLSSATQKINLESRLQETVGSDYDSIITLISQSKMTEFALSSSFMVFQSMQKMSIFNM
ncbi:MULTISPECIES: flagellar hook-associated protein FlgL [Yersinia]|uniref:Flagellar hook-associated protein FlgL n=1 Tax=Yersinia proxima TaxID=2890316 RepID=A0ABW9F1K7_9GAMM|nr:MULTISPECIES: flagellar hook-associated protein FlgL [Yersinia]ELI7923527.1 flagellar hook-associated protein FlgL [Yersinia enterocolitica]